MTDGKKCVTSGVEYTLYRKNIKNMYIRITRAGEVKVSANRRLPTAQIEDFVRINADKILSRLSQFPRQTVCDEPQIDIAQCKRQLEEISRRIYPLFAQYLKEPPQIKVKKLSGTWGICHPTKNYISLSTRLYGKPQRAAEYVVLHEYAHFVHPNHQKEFYALIEKLMPDYRERAALLRTEQ